MLIYLGGDHWKQEEFLPYVAYLGKGADKRAKDWFYDSYLFLAYGGAPSGTAYYNGPTVKADWEFYYDMLFRNDRALRALEACIHDVAKTLGQPPRETPVILMIPYLSPRQRSFGDVDGDGASEDLSREADREKVVTWCVDELCRRWEKAGFTSLKLWGFYWMNEDIGPEDEALIRSTAAYVHRRGYGLHWIPYYRAAGVDKAYPLGFDFVIQQPNYAFMEQHGQRPEAQRLIDAAEAARRRQMGIEIEMPDRVLDRQDRRNLLEYLVYGRDEREGYMRGAVHGYYQSTGAIARLCFSDVPAERALYDALYEFAKGRFQGDTPHPFPACTYRVDARVVAGLEDDGRKLTDGLWASRESQIQRAVGFEGSEAAVVMDLGVVRPVARVRVHVVAPESGRGVFPQAVQVATSLAEGPWLDVEQTSSVSMSLNEGRTAAFLDLRFRPRDARRVRVTIRPAAGKISLVDEIVVEPAESLLEATRCTLSPAPRDANMSPWSLTDEVYAHGQADASNSVSWDAGATASAVVELAEPRNVGSVRLHSPVPGDMSQIQETALFGRASDAAPWHALAAGPPERGDGFLSFAITKTSPLKQIKIDVKPKPEQSVVLDEIEAYPAENLALGKPYQLDPPLPAEYPDPEGKKLTDGQLCQQGFGDQRTVGWYNAPVEITLDLRETLPVERVRVHAEGGGYGAVNFPAFIALLTSTDGRSWSWVASTRELPQQLLVDEPREGQRMQLAWIEVELAPVPAKLVKLCLVSNGWTMVSEVEVVSQGRNVARGIGYRLNPQPTSSARGSDTTGKLTDGVYATSNLGARRTVGWNKGRPAVVIDLEAPQRVSAVWAHVGSGRGRDRLPESMAASTSLDGKIWQPAAVATGRPPDEENQSVSGYMAAQFEPRQCRFVRLEFVLRDELMLDEVEVFGPDRL